MITSSENPRIIVTGGAGFLGGYVVDELKCRGYSQIVVPRSAEHDLRREDEIARLFSDAARGENCRAATMASVIHTDPLPKSAIRHVRCTQERETIPLPPGAPQGEAGWKPRDWLATRSIPLQ